MSSDPTEPIRRQRLAEINTEPGGREALEAEYGQVWDTCEMGKDFQVLGFMAPFVVVAAASRMACVDRWSSSITLAISSTGSQSELTLRLCEVTGTPAKLTTWEK